jgi:uncharacterized protein involved in exopolysaccharide biosynthesis/Mrp family chromosome partitioning ATPase
MPSDEYVGLVPRVSLVDLAKVVLRRKWSIVLIVIASVVGTMGYVILIRGDAYIAEARLLVRLGQEQAPAPTTIADRQMMVGSQGGYGSGELELLSSRDLIGLLVDRVDLSPKPRPPPESLYGWLKEQAHRAWDGFKDGLDSLLIFAGVKVALTPREQAIESVAKALKVESPPLSNLVVARVTWSQRGAPELLLKNLLDVYFAHRSTIYQGATAATFFHEQREENAVRLAEAEAALSKFEREHGISNPDEQRISLLRRLAEAETSADSARVELERSETSLRQFNEARDAGEHELAMFAVSNFGTALQQTLASQLSAAAAKWLSAQATLNAQDQNVRKLRAELNAISNMLVQQLQATVVQWREAFRLRETLRDNIRDELQALQNSLAKWQELRRGVTSGSRAYELYDNKLNEARGIAALEQARIGNVVVVQQPSELATPVGVRKTTMLQLSVAAGLLLAAIWVTACEFFDHRLHGPDEIERHLGVSGLGAIPLDSRSIARGGRRPSNETEAAIARVAMAVARAVPPPMDKAIVVTSSEAGEGTTFVCAHLGSQLVRLLGLRVLLVDLSGVDPTLARTVEALEIPPTRISEGPAGLVATCSGKLPQFAIVSPLGAAAGDGEARSGPAAERISNLLQFAQGAYDLVLVDAPPILTSVAGLLAARAGRRALLVCAANQLPYETIKQSCSELTQEGAQVIGCVLNRYRRELPRWLESMLR